MKFNAYYSRFNKSLNWLQSKVIQPKKTNHSWFSFKPSQLTLYPSSPNINKTAFVGLGGFILISFFSSKPFALAEELLNVKKQTQNQCEGGGETKWNDDWDHKHSTYDPNGPRILNHIILVRHGQYINDEENTDTYGHLTKLGEIQAKLTGDRLSELIGLDNLTSIKISASTMIRAQQTAAIITSTLNQFINKHTGRDSNMNDNNDRNHKSSVDNVLKVESSFLLEEGVPCAHDPKHPTWNPTDYEQWAESARIEAGFRYFIHRPDQFIQDEAVTQSNNNQATALNKGNGTVPLVSGKTIHRYHIIVCHGNVIRYFLLRALQLNVHGWLRFSIFNCGISHLVVDSNGRVSCHGIGDIGHLRKEQITYS